MSDTRTIARDLLACALAWEPGVRLLGNVTAEDIAALCRERIAEARHPMSDDERRRALAWKSGTDTGLSSETIWFVMVGLPLPGGDIPFDHGDFGRCYRLLSELPEWRERLPEVAAAHPEWGAYVDAWDDLAALYSQRDFKALNKQLRRCCDV